MYFKRLEINGFKSFADPVTIEFTQGITCVVGPNGSGKSNISDAIRWVLGEQSPKMLRGGKMEEVIFAGTQNRKAKGMAEVTLVIDNSDHSLPIEYTEVAITRRMYRSGESEYLINKNICRLRDVRELIMDTGIGVEGYSIIGQGKIADIVSNKMDSRREIFEEAAGVVKYRSKKAEAERKLESADTNLSRVNDIIHEIEGRIDKLKDDSEKAAEYLEINDKYKDIEINIILTQVKQTEEKVLAVNEEVERLEKSIENAEKSGAEISQKLSEKREESRLLEEKLSDLRTKLSNKKDELSQLASQDEVNRERKSHIEEDKTRLSSEVSDLLEKLSRENDNNNSLLEAKKEAQDEIEDLKNQLSKSQAETKAQEKLYEEASGKLSFASYEEEQAKIEKSRLSARITLLDELEKSYEGYSGGVRFIMDRKIPGIIGTLGDLLIVPRGFELAIETELGGKLQNIVCQNDEVASNAIDLLKKNKAGRLTFLPVEDLKPMSPLSVEKLKNLPGFVGLASEKVKCEGGYKNIIDYVLGNVVLVDNLDHAIAMSKKNFGPHKFVTLEGEIINSSGALTGGSLKNNTSNILSRKGEKEELKKQLKAAEEKLKEISDSKKSIMDEVDASGTSDAKDKETDILIRSSKAEAKLKSISEMITLVESGISEIETNIDSKKLQIESADRALNQIDSFSGGAEDALKKLEEEKDSLANDLSNAENNKFALSDELSKLEDKESTGRGELYDLQLKKHDIEIKSAKFEAQVDALKDKLWDEFEMSYAQAFEHEDPEFVLSKALKESREYKERLRAIGDVNIGSIEEYKEVSERYGFLTAQREDINKAMAELRTVISDMDKIIREKFKENFNLVMANFEDTFKDLFKGGTAKLSMEDPDNPLESAIEIEAQPPGKKLQNMNLLSGGEKTLTAIALMFAVLKAKPTPFCILDEIEAALDEANIDTVASYIRSFAGPQFTLITHQKLTMEYADVLYGVTMPESGITQVLSLKLGDDFEV